MDATRAITAGARMMPNTAHSSQPSPFLKGCLSDHGSAVLELTQIGSLRLDAAIGNLSRAMKKRNHSMRLLVCHVCTHLRLILKNSLGRGVKRRSVMPTTAMLVTVSSSCARSRSAVRPMCV